MSARHLERNQVQSLCDPGIRETFLLRATHSLIVFTTLEVAASWEENHEENEQDFEGAY